MALPPNGPIEVVFSLDTTGSMSSILDEVRHRLQDMITRLQADIPGIRFAVVAHGDYCDAEHFYVTKHVDFTDDLPTLCNFMNDVGGTGGGDVSECYELVLRLVRDKLSWTPYSQQILIMVGDAYPHEADYPLNVDKIDWREELHFYTHAGVHIYGVHVFEDEQSASFMKTISEQTSGEYIKMADFNHVCDVIMAICYRERGADFLEGYEAEVRSRFGKKPMDDGLEDVFGALKRADSKASNTTLPPPLSPLSSMTSSEPSTSETNIRKISSIPHDPLNRLPKLKTKVKARKVATTNIRGDETTSMPFIKPKITKHIRYPKKMKPSAAKCKKPEYNQPQRKLLRERVTVNNFLYNNLHWSTWKLAIQPRPVTKQPSPGWKTVNNQLRRTVLFRGSRRTRPTFYEVAVQTKPGHKRHVVYFSVKNFSEVPENWFNVLFDDDVSHQVKSVVSSGCRVFVRRAHLVIRKPNTPTRFLNDVRRVYDYPWGGSRDVYIQNDDVYISKQ
ncbi:uncharacterized protein LOC126824045 [Patella vulgata]|uniref:uncharacterized protein LOC126824045 n=1 Tax=Patella vulgata TaxID=6465 RepID=UPI0024A817BD|nr:uncharacterized protein LOC126824045 [Patella vulgata]